MTNGVLRFDDDGVVRVTVSEKATVGDSVKTNQNTQPVRPAQSTYDDAIKRGVAEKILQDESTARGEIALYLTKSFVWLLLSIIVIGICCNALFTREVISVHELLSTFGGIYATVLSFVLGYYFGKDKK